MILTLFEMAPFLGEIHLSYNADDVLYLKCMILSELEMAPFLGEIHLSHNADNVLYS